jgi:hypothetical protein
MDSVSKTFLIWCVAMVLVTAAAAVVSALIGVRLDVAIPASMAVMILIGMVVIYIPIARASRRRLRWLPVLAARFGFAWSPRDTLDIPARYGHYSLFQGSHGWKAINVLHGRIRGMSCICFETPHSHSPIIAVDSGLKWPYLSVRPRPEQDGERKEGQLIEMESRSFNEAYAVRAFNARFAYAVLHARVIELIMGLKDEVRLEFIDTSLYVIPGIVDDAGEYEALIAFTDKLLELIPPYLWQDLREAQDDREA